MCQVCRVAISLQKNNLQKNNLQKNNLQKNNLQKNNRGNSPLSANKKIFFADAKACFNSDFKF